MTDYLLNNWWVVGLLGASVGLIIGGIIGLALGWQGGRRETLAEIWTEMNSPRQEYHPASEFELKLKRFIVQELDLKYLKRKTNKSL